jgi:hypothetical protein
MSKYLGSVVVVLLGVACGGTTDINDPSGGGATMGGAGSGGKNGGGSAGKSSGGSIAMGGSLAVGGFGGVGGGVVVAGNGGVGGKWVDSRCPERLPMGECRERVTCQYDQFNGCLCYSGSSYGLCDQVDPYCPNGSSAGGAPPAAPAQDGDGGFSTKIAVPPQQLCSCVNGTWSCSFGFAR